MISRFIQRKKGILLGIVGTDIPVSQLENIVSKHRVSIQQEYLDFCHLLENYLNITGQIMKYH